MSDNEDNSENDVNDSEEDDVCKIQEFNDDICIHQKYGECKIDKCPYNHGPNSWQHKNGNPDSHNFEKEIVYRKICEYRQFCELDTCLLCHNGGRHIDNAKRWYEIPKFVTVGSVSKIGDKSENKQIVKTHVKPADNINVYINLQINKK